MKIVLEKGKLAGYSLSDPITIRRKILAKYAKENWGKVVKRLNVLVLFNKNKHPTTALKFKKDMIFIQNNFGKKKSTKKRSYKKSTKKRSYKKSTKKRSY